MATDDAFIIHGVAVGFDALYYFYLTDSLIILLSIFLSDGDLDCLNGADEQNCSHTTTEPSTKVDNIMPTCHDWMYQCENEKCVPYWW